MTRVCWTFQNQHIPNSQAKIFSQLYPTFQNGFALAIGLSSFYFKLPSSVTQISCYVISTRPVCSYSLIGSRNVLNQGYQDALYYSLVASPNSTQNGSYIKICHKKHLPPHKNICTCEKASQESQSFQKQLGYES